MSLVCPNDRRDAEDTNGGLSFREHNVLCKEGNSGDVVEMGMGDEDLFYLELIPEIQDVGEASCVEKDSVV